MVPAAASYTSTLAAFVCSRLKEPASSVADLKHALMNANFAPDLQNIVLEIGARRPDGCSTPGIDVAGLLFEQAKKWVQEAKAHAEVLRSSGANSQSMGEAPPILQHDRRSVAFALAAADKPDVAKWLAEEVGMRGGAWALGLRVVDRISLLERLARGRLSSFQAVQHALTTSGERLKAANASTFGAQDREELEVLQGALTLGVPAASGEPPGWAALEPLLGTVVLQQARALLNAERAASKHLFPILMAPR